MSQVRYVKEPGYVYDLMFIFILYYNKASWGKRFVSKERRQEDMEFYESIINRFPPFPDELKPFFYLNENNKSLLTEYYFQEEIEHYFGGHSTNYLYSKLSDTLALKNAIIKCYLPNFVFDDVQSLNTYALNRSLIKSELPDDIKQWILAILLDTKEYSKQLCDLLYSAESVVSEYHKEYYSETVKLCDEFDIISIQETFSAYNRDYNFDSGISSFSICVFSRNLMRFDFSNDQTFLIFGKYGEETIRAINKKSTDVDVLLYGKILSDGSRMKILQMLGEKHEMSTGEIAQKLLTALPTAYYHLEMMLSAGMLCSRNEGRAVYYVIEQEYFYNAAESVLRIIKGEKK